MITEDLYIGYYENLASVHKVLQHGVDGNESFFTIEDPDELGNFDEALRSTTAETVMLLVAAEGELDDNDSENHVQSVDLEMMILQRKRDGVSIPDIRTACLGLLKEFLGRTKKDARYNRLIVGKNINFRISNIPIRKVGPMHLEWYGYVALLRFTCPFGYTVDSGTWTDI